MKIKTSKYKEVKKTIGLNQATTPLHLSKIPKKQLESFVLIFNMEISLVVENRSEKSIKK